MCAPTHLFEQHRQRRIEADEAALQVGAVEHHVVARRQLALLRAVPQLTCEFEHALGVADHVVAHVKAVGAGVAAVGVFIGAVIQARFALRAAGQARQFFAFVLRRVKFLVAVFDGPVVVRTQALHLVIGTGFAR